MNDKKSLDRLFQEKFKDFESEPNPQVWKNIEAALKEKDDRKVIPFWWKLSGVAAVLLIGLFAWNLISDKNSTENGVVLEQNKVTPENPTENDAVVNEDSPKSKVQSPKSETVVNQNSPIKSVNPDNSVTSSDNNAVADESNVIQNKKSKNNTKIATANSENVVANSAKANNKKLKNAAFKNNESNTAVAGINKSSIKEQHHKGIKKVPSQNEENNTSVASTNTSSIKEQQRKDLKNAEKPAAIVTPKNNTQIAGVSSGQSKNNQSTKATTSGQVKFDESQPEKAVAATDVTNKGKNENNTTSGNLKTANEKIAVKETPENNKLDTVPAMTEPNPLEELLKQKNEKETRVAVTKLNRWQITSNVAPVYFSSTSEGSPIDKQFANNDKTYENNLTYGVGVNYAVNKNSVFAPECRN
ncbi:hypothetical protein [Flavobacterium sp. 3HN19-14]|uniref:hypothetical protein n=1 Tax=Flavobacterium sp. 3HN19-14 TaxID=3448133 RepID=UPI003EE32D58